jgi:Fic family protein
MVRTAARHTGPYRAVVAPEIAELAHLLPGEVLALAEDASNAIARFDAEVGTEPAPFASVLLRSESASSSMIENLTSGAKSIALAELGSDEKTNATAIVGNVAAMRAALDLADHLDEGAILAMHRALLERTEPATAGKWRDEQVWIGGSTYGPHTADYIAPHPDRIPAAIADLVRFTQRHDIPVLVHAAIAHAQFETTHPFPDGNGRTGRALIHAMLRAKGLTRKVTVPVSAGLLSEPRHYFDTLTLSTGRERSHRSWKRWRTPSCGPSATAASSSRSGAASARGGTKASGRAAPRAPGGSQIC